MLVVSLLREVPDWENVLNFFSTTPCGSTIVIDAFSLLRTVQAVENELTVDNFTRAGVAIHKWPASAPVRSLQQMVDGGW